MVISIGYNERYGFPLPSPRYNSTLSIARRRRRHRTALAYPRPITLLRPSPPLPSHPTPPPPKQSIRKPKPRRPVAHLPDLVLTHPLHPAVLVASLPSRVDPHEIQRHAAVQHGREADHGERDGVAFDVAGARGRRVQLSPMDGQGPSWRREGRARHRRLTNGAMMPLQFPTINCSPPAVVRLP